MKNIILMHKISTFISRKDISIKNAQNIEDLLESLDENSLITETILMLASYRPCGGEFLYDENQIIIQLNKALLYLTEDVNTPPLI